MATATLARTVRRLRAIRATRARTVLAGSRGPTDRGSATVELAILTPALLLLLAFIIAMGRIGTTNTNIDAAAYAAARAASLSRNAGDAGPNAQSAAADSLTQQGLTCANLQVNVDTSQFALPPGQPAVVTADISCTVALNDLALPAIGDKTITGHAVSTIDTYRQRR